MIMDEYGEVLRLEPSDTKGDILTFPDKAKKISFLVWDKNMDEYNASGIHTINFNNIETIVNERGDYFAAHFPNVTMVIAPKLQLVPSFIFSNNLVIRSKLKEAILPEVKIIGQAAFADTTTLEYVYAPKVEIICNYAFGQSRVQKIELGAIKNIHNEAFYQSYIEEIDCNYANVGAKAFMYSHLKTIKLNSISQLSPTALSECSRLTRIEVQKTISRAKSKFPYVYEGQPYTIVSSDRTFECISSFSEDHCAHELIQKIYRTNGKYSAYIYCLKDGRYCATSFIGNTMSISPIFETIDKVIGWLEKGRKI